MRSSARKSFRLNGKKETLEVACLRDGTLDCDLETGEVFGIKPDGTRVKKRLKTDDDGYRMFFLNRERPHKRGKPIREMRNGKERLRWRNRRCVLVHRLVKIKAIAVGLGGDGWRKYVRDLPQGMDVNHRKGKGENAARHLELEVEAANRRRREMTDEERERVLQEAF